MLVWGFCLVTMSSAVFCCATSGSLVSLQIRVLSLKATRRVLHTVKSIDLAAWQAPYVPSDDLTPTQVKHSEPFLRNRKKRSHPFWKPLFKHPLFEKPPLKGINQGSQRIGVGPDPNVRRRLRGKSSSQLFDMAGAPLDQGGELGRKPSTHFRVHGRDQLCQKTILVVNKKNGLCFGQFTQAVS